MVKEFAEHQYLALILGGSSGLGLAAAQKLAAHGMNISIVHRNTRLEMKEIDLSFDKIKETGIHFHAFNANVADIQSRGKIIDQLQPYKGRLRCLLHSIAKGSLKAMDGGKDTLSIEDFRLTMEYMAYSLYDWVKALREAGLFAPDARIIAFTSEGGQRAWKHYAAVSASKAALEAIIRNIALEFASYGIRANCIQAGITATASMKKIPGSDQLQSFTLKRNPYQRMTTPEDIADAVYLLCKDEAAWINGCIIPVDGGEHIC